MQQSCNFSSWSESRLLKPIGIDQILFPYDFRSNVCISHCVVEPNLPAWLRQVLDDPKERGGPLNCKAQLHTALLASLLGHGCSPSRPGAILLLQHLDSCFSSAPRTHYLGLDLPSQGLPWTKAKPPSLWMAPVFDGKCLSLAPCLLSDLPSPSWPCLRHELPA